MIFESHHLSVLTARKVPRVELPGLSVGREPPDVAQLKSDYYESH